MSRYRRHYHAKKRHVMVVKKTAKYQTVDRATFAVAIIEPVMTTPQVWAIYHNKTAAGVSILSWGSYWLFGLVWLWYGAVHKDKAILTYQALYTVLETAILIGAIMYHGSL